VRSKELGKRKKKREKEKRKRKEKKKREKEKRKRKDCAQDLNRLSVRPEDVQKKNCRPLTLSQRYQFSVMANLPTWTCLQAIDFLAIGYTPIRPHLDAWQAGLRAQGATPILIPRRIETF
jgi:hypothetical protein